MREDRCVDLLRWNNNNFKELGRKLKFKAKIGQKMSLKFNFKTDKAGKSRTELETSRGCAGPNKVQDLTSRLEQI